MALSLGVTLAIAVVVVGLAVGGYFLATSGGASGGGAAASGGASGASGGGSGVPSALVAGAFNADASQRDASTTAPTQLVGLKLDKPTQLPPGIPSGAPGGLAERATLNYQLHIANGKVYGAGLRLNFYAAGSGPSDPIAVVDF